MALTLIKEDGSGKADANAYASAADGDAYHDGHLYATAWTGATTGKKEAALVMATRMIDAHYQFNGVRAQVLQALQWPREDCRDPDAEEDALGQRFVLGTVVPKAVLDAACETARALIIEDRRPVIPHVAQAMLAKLGVLVNRKSGVVPLVRV